MKSALFGAFPLASTLLLRRSEAEAGMVQHATFFELDGALIRRDDDTKQVAIWQLDQWVPFRGEAIVLYNGALLTDNVALEYLADDFKATTGKKLSPAAARQLLFSLNHSCAC